LFATIINKFILRNSIYILISIYLLKVSRDKQVSLLVHPICVFWQLSEPLAVISLDAVIPILVIFVRSETYRKKSVVSTIVSMTIHISITHCQFYNICITYFYDFYNEFYKISNNDADAVDSISFSISARFTMNVFYAAWGSIIWLPLLSSSSISTKDINPTLMLIFKYLQTVTVRENLPKMRGI